MYSLVSENVVLRLNDGAIIPADPENSDWQGYQAWLTQGNTPTPAIEPALPAAKSSAVERIDTAAAAIYARVGRFEAEYRERESQALAFRDAGYTGTVPPRVAEFATPAGLTAEVATNIILAQADALRTALGQLSAQRMRKYLVINATSVADARAIEADVLAHIQAIAEALK